MQSNRSKERVALVLAGGGARGAYEMGALSVFVPLLEAQDQRPEIIVGTSIGALNATFLAATAHLPAQRSICDGIELWRNVRYRDVLGPLLAPAELGRLLRYLGELVGVSTAEVSSLLDTSPQASTIPGLISFDQLARNIAAKVLATAAVVATSYDTGESVVFHEGGDSPPYDRERGIQYVQTRLSGLHVRASAAIPVAFPAIRVDEPIEMRGWYSDGGARLNTPIKPALAFGADRVVVIGLNSISASERSVGDHQPGVFEGAAQLLQALFSDTLAHDVATLAMVNRVVGAEDPEVDGKRRIPYIFIAPRDRFEIGRLASDAFKRNYTGVRGLKRRDDLTLLGALIRATRGPVRGELFSYLFFAPEFHAALIDLGREDAERWVATEHDEGLWHHGDPPVPPRMSDHAVPSGRPKPPEAGYR